MLSEHERMRRELWIQVAVAVSASVCNDPIIPNPMARPSSWADAVLGDFDNKFKEENV